MKNTLDRESNGERSLRGMNSTLDWGKTSQGSIRSTYSQAAVLHGGPITDKFSCIVRTVDDGLYLRI